ncbi:MAG: Uma2 family endonuclease [Chloroflexi bacterium]|nr:Uma2 family endonuclease [Chloroflexota bacterium]
MTTAGSKLPLSSSAAAAVNTPWYELINDAPEPPEDAMQQASTILYVMSILMARYKDAPDVLVSEQTNVIYDSDTPGSVVVPDGYVVFGVETETIEMYRRSYRIDEWGVPPAFVLEVASESTAHRDLTEKRALYARMGVTEYWRLDRHGYYGEPLVGERLVDGEYVRFELHTEHNGDTWSRSEVLGVDFFHRVEDGVAIFPLRDSVTREWLSDLGEEITARQTAEVQAREAETRAQSAEHAQLEEREARLAAEARNQELQAELERLRRQQ